MPYENTGAGPLSIPGRKTAVAPGGTFSDKDAEALNVRALERGGHVKYVKPKKEKK